MTFQNIWKKRKSETAKPAKEQRPSLMNTTKDEELLAYAKKLGVALKHNYTFEQCKIVLMVEVHMQLLAINDEAVRLVKTTGDSVGHTLPELRRRLAKLGEILGEPKKVGPVFVITQTLLELVKHWQVKHWHQAQPFVD